MWKRSMILTALALAVLLVTAACASSSGTDGGATPATDSPTEATTTAAVNSEARVIQVELTEFAIAADSFEMKPGETVEFVVTNSGVAEHEFRLSNPDRIDEHIEGGHADHDESAMTDEEMAAMDDEATDHDEDEGDHEGEAADVVLTLAAGETGSVTFTVPDNDHDYTAAVCLIPGHYEAGMATDLSFTS